MLAVRNHLIALVLACCAAGPGAAWALSCAQDLNGNGTIDTVSETATCKATPTGEFCPLSAANCTTTATCPLDPNAPCTAGQCSVPQSCVTTNVGYQCPSTGKSYASLTACTTACQQTAACKTAQTCPIDKNLACMDTGGGSYQCSPNKCVDLSAGAVANNPDVTTTTVNTSMPDNSGPRNPDGTCAGALSIFAGRGMDCKKAGLRSGFHDCCDNGGGAVIADSMGSSVGAQIAQQGLSVMAKFAYTAYTTFGNFAGGSLALADKAAIATNYAYNSVILNPVTWYLAAAAVIVQYFVTEKCSQLDMETAALVGSKFCHYVGTYCSEKWKFIGCVQKKASYCCFNSMLGRIIHEQGRPQLASFTSTPGGIWGVPEAPHCRGFSPGEFQQLDFSAMDLSEYYGHITKVAQDTINAGVPQGTLTNAVQNFYNNLR